MAKEGTPRFEIPADTRALAEKSVEQAKQAFDIFISVAQHAVSTAENQAASVQAGAKEVGELAMGFAERNITSSFEFVQRLLQARLQGRDGPACGIHELADRGSYGTGQGNWRANGQDDWAGLQALNRFDCRIAAISNGAEPALMLPVCLFVHRNIFYCNAPKTSI